MKILRITALIVLSLTLVITLIESVPLYIKGSLLTLGFFLLLISWTLDMKKVIKESNASHRKKIRKRLVVLIVAVLVVAANYFLSSGDLFVDYTETKRFTLSDETVEYLKSLDKTSYLYGFQTMGTLAFKQTESVFRRYKKIAERLHAEVVDPDRNPTFAKKYDVQSSGDAVFVMGDRWVKLGGIFERDLVLGIIKLTVETNTICFTKGHGEPSIYEKEGAKRTSFSKFTGDLEERGFNLLEGSVNKLAQENECDIVVILSPKQEFQPDEISLLREIVENGTEILILEDPFATTNINEFLRIFYLEYVDGILLDETPKIAGAPPTTVSTAMYLAHKITDSLSDISYFPQAKAVKVLEGDDGAIAKSNVNFFINTARDSWLKKNPDAVSAEYSYEEGVDSVGPFSVAAAYREGNKKLVVFGDSDFANNYNYDYGDNAKLILNSINWLLEEKQVIGLPAKETRDTRLGITMAGLNRTKYILVYAFPVVIFIVLFMVWFRRSR